MTRISPRLAALFLLVGIASAESSPKGAPGERDQPGTLHETQRPNSTQAEPPHPVRGADVGWLSEMEAAGKTFRDRNGQTRDALVILKDMGVEAIRLRVWVNPADGWCGRADVLKQAARARRMGFRLMIDFHYSDSWADPGQQNKPAAWAGHGLEQLKTDIRDHTTSMLRALKDSGVVPEWVQVGNETNDGMLWPEGKASTNMAGYAALITAGTRAVKEVSPTSKVIVHLANGWDNGLFRWSFDGLKTNRAEYDVIGMSLYPEPATWRTQEKQLIDNMKDMISRYGKDVILSEVGMDWMAADSTRELLRSLQKDMIAIGPRALGVFYWEPQSHYGWKGYFKGAFDDQGKATIALTAFQEQAAVSVIRRLPGPGPAKVGIHDALGRQPPLPSPVQGPRILLP
jgi:arabinogalactan endo-1,4-beta-galactosidase